MVLGYVTMWSAKHSTTASPRAREATVTTKLQIHAFMAQSVNTMYTSVCGIQLWCKLNKPCNVRNMAIWWLFLWTFIIKCTISSPHLIYFWSPHWLLPTDSFLRSVQQHTAPSGHLIMSSCLREIWISVVGSWQSCKARFSVIEMHLDVCIINSLLLIIQ